MPRPRAPRTISSHPVAPLFKPGGVCAPAQVRLGEDEFEALRLADVEGLPQTAAAARMGVSRQTFGRVLRSARRKVSRALVLGLALLLEGGLGERGRVRALACGADPDDCARCGQARLVVLGTRSRVTARGR